MERACVLETVCIPLDEKNKNVGLRRKDRKTKSIYFRFCSDFSPPLFVRSLYIGKQVMTGC